MKTNVVKIKNFALSQKAKSKLKYTTYAAVVLASLGIGGVALPAAFHAPTSGVVSADTVNPVVHGKWGGADYTIDNGVLTLSGGDIGTPANVGNSTSGLAAFLSAQGIKISTITQIKIADKMAAKDIPYAFANFSKLRSITGLENLSYSGNASHMFYNDFDLTSLDLSNFETSKITNMSNMFSGLKYLKKLDLSNFDTSSVTDMSAMFSGATSLTSLDVSSFDTSNVTNMSRMFSLVYNSGQPTKLTSLDISNFNTHNVTDMSGMFEQITSLERLDVSNFDTSNVTNMSDMFNGLASLTSLDISNFDTHNVTNMSGMFSIVNYSGLSSKLTKLDVSNLDTSNVIDMSEMFSGLESLKNLNVSNFSTGKATNMADMFEWLSSLTSLDVSNFDTHNVTDMSAMFYGASSLTSLNVSHFDTHNVTDMSGMFNRLASLTALNVSSFDTSNVTSMNNNSGMFQGDSSLTSLDLSSFDTSKITDMSFMFEGDSALTNLNVSHFNTGNVINMEKMFAGLALKNLDVSNFDTSKVTDMHYIFSQDSRLEQLDLSSFTIPVNTSSIDYSMFDGDTMLKELKFGRNVHFHQYAYLPAITADDKYTGYWINQGTPTNPAGSNHWTSDELLTNYDPSTMGGDTYVWEEKEHEQGMWGSATFTNNNGALTLSGGNIGSPGSLSGALSLAGIDPSTITSIKIANPMSANDITSAFSNFLNLKSITGLGNLSYSGTAARMFSGDSALTSIDLSNFDTSQITDMTSMFQDNSSLTSLDVSGFNTSNVIATDSMFSGLSSLKSLDVSNFDTSNVLSMDEMFYRLTSLTSLNVSNFDTSKTGGRHYLFAYNPALEQLDLSGLTISSSTSQGSYGMFEGDSALKKLTFGKNTYLYQSTYLPEIPVTDKYTGYWTNLGTPTNPAGTNHWTSEELMTNFDPSTMGGDTYVWEEKSPAIHGNWGSANYSISNGALTVSSNPGANIGTADSLSKALTNSGINPSTITSINIQNEMSAKDISSIFAYLPNLKSVSGLGNLKYSGSAYAMFMNDTALTSIDFAGFDTSHITNMGRMFYGNRSLASVDTSVFNTAAVTDMNYMFSDTSLQNLNLSNFDTQNVTNMSGMFANSKALQTLNLNSFNTQNVTNMYLMFMNTSALEKLDLTSFTITSGTTATSMFSGDKAVKELKFGANVHLSSAMGLPNISATGNYTGYWTNQAGSVKWTSSELLTNYNPATMAGDTYVWQTK